jgi:hypothetical protein
MAMNSDAQRINEYFATLKSWPKVESSTSPGAEELDAPSEVTEEVPGGAETCLVRKLSIVDSPSEFVKFEPDPNLLWVGSILQGKNFCEIGSLAEVPIRERAPLKLSLNIPMDNNSVVVESPSNSSIWQATSDLIQKVSAVPEDNLGRGFFFKIKETFTFDQTYLELGLSARFAGASMRAKHEKKATSKGSSLSVCYIDNCFTVSMDNPQTPADFFSDSFSFADLNQQVKLGRISDDNIPIFLAGITYGHMLFVTFYSEESYEEIFKAVSAAFRGLNGGAAGDYTEGHRKLVLQSEKTISANSANEKQIESLINEGMIGEYLTKSTVSTAKPLSFSFYRLTDNNLALLSERATYMVRQCGPYRGRPSENVGMVSQDMLDSLRAYNNYVIAACQNWADHETRRIRRDQFRRFHSDTVTGFNDLRLYAVTADDKIWVVSWAASILAEIERQIKCWQIGYDSNTSDPGTRDVHAEALSLSRSLRVLCLDLIKYFSG